METLSMCKPLFEKEKETYHKIVVDELKQSIVTNTGNGTLNKDRLCDFSRFQFRKFKVGIRMHSRSARIKSQNSLSKVIVF